MDEDVGLLLKLSGVNQVNYGEVFPWATDIVVGFPDLKKDLRVKSYDFSENRLFPAHPTPSATMIYQRSSKITLKELEKFLFNENTRLKISNSVEVYVLAKRKVSVIPNDTYNDALFGTSVTVGDDTGICNLTMFNDAIESIFNQIEVGDKLLIAGGTLQGRMSKHNSHGSIISSKKLLAMEIKLNVFDARKTYIVKDDLRSGLPAVMRVLTEDKAIEKLWTSTDILRKDNEEILFKKEKMAVNKNQNWDRHIMNIDIIGIIKHAGRLERREKFKDENKAKVICKINGITASEKSTHPISETECFYTFQDYSAFRWLELIDLSNPESEPLRVKMFINDMKMWDAQPSLIPGSLVVITRCIPKLNFMGKYVMNSFYSEIFTPEKLCDYWRHMPKHYFNTIRTYKNREIWKSLVKMTTFTVGGSYCQRIRHEELFDDCKPKFNQKTHGLPHPQDSFLTKEVQRIIFTGRITNHYEIGDNEDDVAVMGPGTILTPLISFEKFLLLSCCRKLPKISVEGTLSDTDIKNRIIRQYKKYAKEACSTTTTPNSFAGLELSQNMNYYMLEIKDKLDAWLYYAYWFGESKEEMENRLQDTEGKDLDFIIDVQLISSPSESSEESLNEFEVIVHDFCTTKWVC